MSFKTDGIAFKLREPLYLHVLIYYPFSYPTKNVFFFYQNVKKNKFITFAFKWFYAWTDRMSVAFSHFHDLTQIFLPRKKKRFKLNFGYEENATLMQLVYV